MSKSNSRTLVQLFIILGLLGIPTRMAAGKTYEFLKKRGGI